MQSHYSAMARAGSAHRRAERGRRSQSGARDGLEERSLVFIGRLVLGAAVTAVAALFVQFI